MDAFTYQTTWNDLAPFDPELDKAIHNFLQTSSETSPAAPLPPWFTSTGNFFPEAAAPAPFPEKVGAGNTSCPSWQTSMQGVPHQWSMDFGSGLANNGAYRGLEHDVIVSTPVGVESLNAGLGQPLGNLAGFKMAGDDSVSLEDIMDLDHLAKESSTPLLSPSSVDAAPLSAEQSIATSPQDRLSNYHNDIAAGHARNLHRLVDIDRLGSTGHPNAHSLASSISHAVLPAASIGRPNVMASSGNARNGMTIQQRRRMTLMAQKASRAPTHRKRQASAPGSCLPGILTSPNYQSATFEVDPSSKAVPIEATAKPSLPGKQDSEWDWSDVVLANSHDLVFVLSLKGTVLYISPSVERILGFLTEEIVGRALIDFCHPADVGPLMRELKDSTTVSAGEEDRSSSDDQGAKAHPRINLVVRMITKGGSYSLIEATGSLSVDSSKHRKVVVCSGRPHPIPMLPWDHVRGDLRDPEPSAWLKLSHSGIFLGCTGPINKILGIENVNLVGRHIRDLPMVSSSTDLLDALHCGRTISVQDHVEGSDTGKAPVKLTVYPWTSDGRSSTVAFVHVQQRPNQPENTNQLPVKRKALSPAEDLRRTDSGEGSLTGSAPTPSGGTTCFMSQGDAAATVFSELTAYHGGSWLVEMQKLQNANKRLRHELQALTKRTAH